MFTRRTFPSLPSLPRPSPDCIGLPSPRPRRSKTITIFAAASMKNALDDINAAFTKQTGIKMVASYAASSALMKQIENGAPADVFRVRRSRLDGLRLAEEARSRTTAASTCSATGWC